MPDGSEMVPNPEWNQTQLHQKKKNPALFVNNNKLGMVDSSNSFQYEGDVGSDQGGSISSSNTPTLKHMHRLSTCGTQVSLSSSPLNQPRISGVSPTSL